MGKTDSLIIPIYKRYLQKYFSDSVDFFGSTSKDKLCQNIKSARFFDLQIGNWNINTKWSIQTSRAVCLRTSGFAINPNDLITSFSKNMDKNGILLIDWSLGSDHYPRESKKWTWGWGNGADQCYGEYKNKKCYLYSSYLSRNLIISNAYQELCNFAAKQIHYQQVKNHYEQIQSEFKEYLLNHELLEDHFSILEEKIWTPLTRNGRAQLYTIQILRKK